MSSRSARAPRHAFATHPGRVRWLRVAGWVIVAGLLAAWILILRPQSLGGSVIYVMVAGESMEPTYESGDFVVARQRNSYKVGDVIIYRVPEGSAGAGRLIIHRVIDGDLESGLITQGDNREVPDQWRPTGNEVVGKLWFHIPNAASALRYMRSPVVLTGFFGVLTLFFIVFRDQDEEKDEVVGTEPELSGAPPPPPPPLARPDNIVVAEAAEIVEPTRPSPRRVATSPLIGAGLLAALVGYLLYRRRRT